MAIPIGSSDQLLTVGGTQRDYRVFVPGGLPANAPVVANIESRVAIDHSRVYATGISNGGMMDYRLACDTGIFAAIGPDSATLLGDCPSPPS